jgi:hypothetical protein
MKTSESIKEISKAIIAFHSKVPKVKKDEKNPFFGKKYASLANILDVISTPLNECGLAIIQQPCGVNQLETILLHESGEFISECYEMKPAKQDPQGDGSRITYQRRYAVGAILSLNIDEDDDGNKASEPDNKEQPQPVKKSVMPDDRFAKLMDQVRKVETPQAAGNLLGMARRNFTLDNEQEKIVKEWEGKR